MILVTGGTGRIGNVLVKELNKKYGRVRALVRESSDLKPLEGCDCEYVYGDVLDTKSLEKAVEGVDTIFHLAGIISISTHDEDLTLNTNIQGTKNIVDICVEHNIPLIYTSSIHAINALEDGSLISEKTELATDYATKRGIYDYSKATATQYVLDKMRDSGLKAIIVHPTGVSGPYDYRPSFFGMGMVSLVKSGIKTTISGCYDYVDVRDVVDAILKAYELKKYGERYILSGETLSMNDYAEYLKEVANIKAKTSLLDKATSLFISGILSFFDKKSQITPYSVKTLHSNCNISHEKATKELGYNPRSVKESIRDQYLWFKENEYLG